MAIFKPSKAKIRREARSELIGKLTRAEPELASDLGLTSENRSAVVFKPLETQEYLMAIDSIEQMLTFDPRSAGAKLERKSDKFGYRWYMFKSGNVDGLVGSVALVGEQLVTAKLSDQLLAAVFPFKSKRGKTVNLIFNYKNGGFYPFVPKDATDQQRDTEYELELAPKLADYIVVDDKKANWYPMWDMPVA